MLSSQITAIPLRASIRSARFSLNVLTEDIESSRSLLFGVAIDLVSRRAQAVNTVAVEIALPGKKLVDRDVVETARLLDRHPAAAHGFNDGRFAPHRPSLTGSRQVRDLQNIGPIFRMRRVNLHGFPTAAAARRRSRRSPPGR